jgi:pimeloyl-ACP methyl ester carboxylesterase
MATSPQRPTVFCLPAVGFSARSFDLVAQELEVTAEVRAIDLPGFGSAAPMGGASIQQMADHVVSIITGSGAGRWFLAGHSLGGKVASVVAARALTGEPGLAGLAGVALLAASPPIPEPMDQKWREEMLSWLEGDGRLDENAARKFIEATAGAPLPPALDALVVQDLLQASGDAWAAWLCEGSQEDCSSQVGRLDVPAVVLAGSADGGLGPDVQRQVHGPVYPQARFVTFPGAGHLLPLERPHQVAQQILSLLEHHPERHERLTG